MKFINNRLASVLIASTLIVGILSSLGSIPNSKSAIQSGAPLFLNVEDYGAIGNGVVDDRLAIQTAINSVPLTGGTVYFPSGTYRIGSSLLSPTWGLWIGLAVGSSITLQGEGIGKSILKADASLDLNRFIVNAKPGDSKISIKDITVDMGDSPSTTSGSGISFDQANNIRIENTEVKNVDQEAYSLSTVSNFKVENSIANNAWTGIYLTNCNEGEIRQNSISNTDGDGILLRS